MAYHYHQGKFKPNHPEKYVGNVNNIIYRSSLERRFLKWLDESDVVMKYSSEELVIPYYDPPTQKMRRYFPDMVAQMKTKDGIQIFVVEIKPESQCAPPVPKKRKTKRFLLEMAQWATNDSKWKHAEDFCKERGWVFRIITEKHINRMSPHHP